MFIRNETSEWIFKEDNIKYAGKDFSYSEDSEKKKKSLLDKIKIYEQETPVTT